MSREALRREKRGLCMSLTTNVCRLPLEVQLFSLNTALQFADTYGFRFVGPTPDHDHDRESREGGCLHPIC